MKFCEKAKPLAARLLCIAVLISIVIAINSGLVFPLALAGCYGFLCVRIQESTIMDSIRFAFRYFVTTQQHYDWR